MPFRMKVAAWLFVLTAGASFPRLFGQAAPDKDPCNIMPANEFAAKNFLTFDQFDRELRDALTRKDAVQMAFLVTFPLRVNDAGRTISIDNAAALKKHFQDVFTPAVRKEILDEKNDQTGCMTEGIMYARGVIWVNASERGYSIWSVNLDAVPPYPGNNWEIPKIEFICQTQKHRIVVETVAGGILRYRSWNKPRPVTGTPDLEIAKGQGSFEGTNVCAVPVYTFKNATAMYKVEGGLGCYGDSDGPPKGATGRLEVTLDGKPALDSWCY